MSTTSLNRRRRDLEAVYQEAIHDLNDKKKALEQDIWSLEEQVEAAKLSYADAEEVSKQHPHDGNKSAFADNARKILEDLQRKLRSVKRRNESDINQIDNVKAVESSRLRAALAAIDEEEEQFLGDQDPVNIQQPQEKVHQWQATIPDPEAGSPLKGELRMALEVMSKQTDMLQQQLTSAQKPTMSHIGGKDLPTFGGEHDQWPAFIAIFEQTTTHCKISPVDNLYRLQKALKGSAREAVQSLLTSPNNVTTIIKTLERQYGRPELIIKSLISKAKQVPAPHDSKPGTVIRFYNCVRNLVATVEGLNRAEYLMNPALLDELVGKLHPSQRKEWGRFTVWNKIVVPTLKEFADWMETEAEAVMCFVEPDDLLPVKDWRGRKESMFITKEEEQNCWFCSDNGHSLKDCWKFLAADADKRWDWVKKQRRCFSCLSLGHGVEKCKRKKVCGVRGCQKHHHTSLHRDIKEESKNGRFPETEGRTFFTLNSEADVLTTEGKKFLGTSNYNSSNVLLKMVPVVVHGPRGSVSTHALLDEGATCSLLDADLAETLGIHGPSHPLELTWTNDVSEKHKDSEKVSFKICGADGTGFDLKNVYTLRNMNLPTQTFDANELQREHTHLRGICVESQRNAKPLLLLGEDNIHLTIARDIRESSDWNTPIASKTRLGWTLHGKANGNGSKRFAFTINIKRDEELHTLVKESFKVDSIGVKIPTKPLKSKLDERAEKLLDSTTKKLENECRWETGLLWKLDDVTFPFTKGMALRRLVSVERKMQQDAVYRDWYKKKIDYYLEAGYCRKLNEEESGAQETNQFYLPHFAASNPNKPGKLRLVFDAAAKVSGESLNSALLTGPDLLNSLPGVLTRFRRKKIAFGADVKEMFHQIKIRKEDVAAQRFLWRGGDMTRDPETYVMDSMIFGAASSPSSAQYVMRRNASEWMDTYPDAVSSIIRNMYMDDLADCTDEIDEAKNRIAAINTIQDAGGFPMLKWTSNEMAVLRDLPMDKIAVDMQHFDLKTDSHAERVLGLYWDPKDDILTFRFSFPKVKPEIVEGSTVPTKREVLRVTMSLFDPLGILTCFSIQARILLQDIWRSDIIIKSDEFFNVAL